MRLRAARLRANPICQWVDPDGTHCRALAVTVDHVVCLAEGGAEYDFANTQSMCREHAIKKNTADALRGKRRARGEGGF